jgi:hypothetical protein
MTGPPASNFGEKMPADHADDNWPVVAADLRDTLARSGVSETVAARLFAAFAPAVAAIERERTMMGTAE